MRLTSRCATFSALSSLVAPEPVLVTGERFESSRSREEPAVLIPSHLHEMRLIRLARSTQAFSDDLTCGKVVIGKPSRS
jgi:hypothetical protein